MSIYDILLSFFTYGFLGWCTEVAFAAAKQRQFVNRGFLNGPICPIYGVGVTIVIAVLEPFSSHIVFLYIASTILVTVLEGITGYALEKLFHHRWWDYSKMPLNIGGYVCLLFSLIWGVVCVAIVKLIHPLLYKVLMIIPYWLGATILVVCTVALIADIYVTASGILKWNKRLEKLDEIAKELHNISDQIGENIYENMMTGIKLQEKNQTRAAEFREISEAKAAELRQLGKARASELKEISEERKAQLRRLGEEKAQELTKMISNQHKTGKRLLRAFPKLQSNEHDEVVIQLREHIKKRSSKKQQI